jgi:hypothetical protein
MWWESEKSKHKNRQQYVVSGLCTMGLLESVFGLWACITCRGESKITYHIFSWKEERRESQALSRIVSNLKTSKWFFPLAITSPTSGGRSVGIVRSRTQTMEFSLVYPNPYPRYITALCAPNWIVQWTRCKRSVQLLLSLRWCVVCSLTFFLFVNVTILDSVVLSVPHKKHITSPLRVQQVNAVYRFETMVYSCN